MVAPMQGVRTRGSPIAAARLELWLLSPIGSEMSPDGAAPIYGK